MGCRFAAEEGDDDIAGLLVGPFALVDDPLEVGAVDTQHRLDRLAFVGTLAEIVELAASDEPSVERDEMELVALCPCPVVRLHLCAEDLDSSQDIVERVMCSLKRMAVVAGIGGGEVTMVAFASLRVDLTGHMDTLECERIVPGAVVEVERETESLEVIMEDRRVVVIAVVGENVASVCEGDELRIDVAQRDAVVEEELPGDMVYRLRLCGDGEVALGQDIPVALVDGLPGFGIELHERELDDVVFLYVEAGGLGIKTNKVHNGMLYGYSTYKTRPLRYSPSGW